MTTESKFTYRNSPTMIKGKSARPNNSDLPKFDYRKKKSQFGHGVRPDIRWIKDLLLDSDLQPLISESKVLGKMQKYIGKGRSLGDSRAMVDALNAAEKQIDRYIGQRSSDMDLGVNYEYSTKRECLRMIENAVNEGQVEFQAETGVALPR